MIDAAGDDITDKVSWHDDQMPFDGRNYGVFAFPARREDFSGIVLIVSVHGLPLDTSFGRWKYRYGRHW